MTSVTFIDSNPRPQIKRASNNRSISVMRSEHRKKIDNCLQCWIVGQKPFHRGKHENYWHMDVYFAKLVYIIYWHISIMYFNKYKKINIRKFAPLLFLPCPVCILIVLRQKQK